VNRRGSLRVFVDTSALFALLAPRENNHLRAVSIQRSLRRERAALYATNYIVAETHAMVLSRLGRRLALETLRDLDSNAYTIVRVDEHEEAAARQIIERYTDKDFSLVDAISFVVMETLGIDTAFTFDVNFRQYGFETL